MTGTPSPDEAPPAERPGRLRRFAVTAAVYAGITLATLALLDVVLMVTGLFPPSVNPGHPEVGWVSASPTGEQVTSGCWDPYRDQVVEYERNEDALRTSWSSADLRGPDPDRLEIAVSGDSHTDLCAPNELVHFGFTERMLTESGLPAAAYSFGAGKYSPLQAYMAVKPAIQAYEPDAFVLNLYTGNDFYDMLRIDDRPHFVPTASGYDIAPPIWFQETPPGTRRRSRVLFAIRTLMDRTGVSNALVRIRYLRAAAAEQGQGVGAVVAYMNDLRRSTSDRIGYSAALSAQMLNQRLFFHRFPGTKEESLRRMQAFLELVRAENPELTLVLSPIPSYQLVFPDGPDPVFEEVLARLPVTYRENVAEEEELYEAARTFAADAGWLFSDNLTTLRAYSGDTPLYNDFDYHIEPVASEMIARNQAEILRSTLRPDS